MIFQEIRNHPKRNLLRLALLALCGIVFFTALYFLNPFSHYRDTGASTTLKMSLLLSLIYIMPVFLFLFVFPAHSRAQTALALLILAVILYLRAGFFDHKTMDHEYHLDLWLDYFRENGAFAALRSPVGNYNLPYLYIIAGTAASGVSNMHVLLKFIALLFEFFGAFWCMMIAGLQFKTFAPRFLAFAMFLCLPTVIFNNSYWGQCDIIFTSFLLGSIYFLMTGRNGWAMAFWGVAFAFKAQAFFLAPLYFFLFCKGNLRIRDAIWAPLSYFLMHAPGLCAGYPFSRMFTVYTGQFSEVEKTRQALVYNAPSIYQLFAENISAPFQPFATFGMGITMALVLLVAFWAISQAKWKIASSQMPLIAAFFSLLVPFLLPGMADRSFFIADAVFFVAALTDKRLILPAVMVNFASWMSYSFFLYGKIFIDYRYLSALNLVALYLTAQLLLSLPTQIGAAVNQMSLNSQDEKTAEK